MIFQHFPSSAALSPSLPCNALQFNSLSATLKAHNQSPHPVHKPKSTHSLSTQTHTSNNFDPHFSILHDITNLCETGSLASAFTLLKTHHQNAPSASSPQSKQSISLLLHACAQQNDIETARKLHRFLTESTHYENDYILNTSLITVYSMCGSPSDACQVFDDFPMKKNLVQWNALISAYTRNYLYFDAIHLFVDLISETQFRPDNFTCPCALKACGAVLGVGPGETIHGMVVKMGLVFDVFVGNALVGMYGKFGFVEEAAKVFDFMPERNLVSWNSMICVLSENGFFQAGFSLFVEMLEDEEGLLPDVATIVIILPVCGVGVGVDLGMGVHGLAVKLGLSEEVMVNNALVDMYSKCGCLGTANFFFEKNSDKNIVSWNTMIGNFSSEGDVFRTFDLIRKMQMEREKMKANEVTLLNVLPVCVDKCLLLSLKELHGYSFRHGIIQHNEMVANAFVAAYAKCGTLSSAERVFKNMETKNVSSWNALIGGCAQNGDPRKALDLYIQMTYLGLEPDWFSIGSLLLACSNLKSLHYGKEIHGFVLRNGLETDSFIAISLISQYTHCGKPSSALVLFDRMEDKSLVAWNAMIAGYSQNGLPNEALYMFRKLISDGIEPCKITMSSVFQACSQQSALQIGKEAHCYALKALFTEDTFVSCSIIDMYAKCGCIKESQRVFDGLKEKGLASWNAIIAAYAVHGDAKEAIHVVEKMTRVGLVPDDFTYIGILMACSHAGLIEEGLKYFNEMKNIHDIEPKLEHYACVIDMVGRAGELDQAISLVNEMPMEPDSGIWSSLLSACRTFGRVERGEKVAEKLLELEPNKAENHVLLSNLYAASGQWGDVRKVRQTMKEIGLQKVAGCSWIELGGKVHSFIVGDNLLSESEEIRMMWKRLEEKYK